jgi:hypothetical protein
VEQLGFPLFATGVTSGARTTNPSTAHESPQTFSEVHVAQSLVFCVVFLRSLFVLFVFFSFPLYYLSFGLHITSLVSSKAYCIISLKLT